MPDTTSALGGVGLLHHRSAASGKISSGSKFETSPLKPTSSSSLINRSARNGSVKGGGAKTQRDQALENKVLQWILDVTDEKPPANYEQFIQDGSVISKVMTSIVFNSVPVEDIEQTWGSNPAIDRVRAVIREMRRYGVVDVFDVEDLLELRNVNKVTKCLEQLSKLAATDHDCILTCRT